RSSDTRSSSTRCGCVTSTVNCREERRGAGLLGTRRRPTMSEPVVTHADLPYLRDLREVLDGHINVGPEIALLDRLIAAAMFSAAPPPPTNPEHSFTSRDLQDLYEWWLAQEPPQDAGGHPSLPVHEVVGQK